MVEKKKHGILGWQPWEWCAAGLAGAGAGIVGAVTRTYSLFHNKVLNYPQFEDMYNDRSNKPPTAEDAAHTHPITGEPVSHETYLSEITKKAIEDRKNAPTAEAKEAITNAWIKAQHDGKMRFGNRLDDKLLKDLGIENRTWKGLKQRWGTFGTHRRDSVKFAAGASALVGVGATLTFLNNYHMRQRVGELVDKIDALHNGPSRDA